MSQSPQAGGKKPRYIIFRLLGPGLVTGAADDDPSGIATYSQAGAQFGYGLLWTVFLTTPFMIAIQLVSAQIGRVTGKGTTISPYLFFWQASQEVEEMSQGKHRRPLKELSHGGHPEIDRIAIDTTVGMIFSNVIAFFIILTTAAVLNAGGVTNIQSAAQAAEALRPLAGELTFLLFAMGIIGTGLLAIPVLAGSAAYGVAEAFGWPATLEAKAPDAVGFYGIIAAATSHRIWTRIYELRPNQNVDLECSAEWHCCGADHGVMMIIISKVELNGTFQSQARGSSDLDGAERHSWR